ncbi:MAG TPA: glycosyltransferase family 4 protein [Candidatus Levybacteria bacterium]|nr:glycosyltransferase family 4 protein [Candidatus Levybacteria bacterium]
MKVLICLSYYIPNVSGLTIYAKNLAEQLASRGHNVTVLTSHYDKSLLETEINNKVKIIRIPMTFRISKGPMMMTFPFRCIEPVRNSDVVNCHLPSFESFFIAICSKILRKKVVVTYHSGLSWEGGGFFYKFAKIALLISELITAVLADEIIVNTNDYAKKSRLVNVFHKKVSSIFPPIVISKSTMELKKVIEKSLPKKKGVRIGMAGRLSTEKGLEFLLDAIPLLKKKTGDSFTIVIVGPKNPIGEEDYLKQIETKLAGYKNNITFLGALPYEQLGSYYSILDVLVLPSINSTESFGMVQVEAMLSGTPVIASNLPGVRVPIALTQMGALVRPRSSIDLADKILKITRNKEKYLRKRNSVEKVFSLSKTIDQYEKVLSR